ncbi:hypothetical protein A1OE_1510 [Candidatus Endolissoclinum faulkneri L2]|uniref:Uncharacterized protein n=1 Tax=Candidatus Endolissoclinum faulkneri L2 TaxID=1193729 RepID=K7YSW8_9PROT|nr:hypothetical protein A1OE_1510 [Candidatus Endolissoclinum faulkneri L2]
MINLNLILCVKNNNKLIDYYIVFTLLIFFVNVKWLSYNILFNT